MVSQRGVKLRAQTDMGTRSLHWERLSGGGGEWAPGAWAAQLRVWPSAWAWPMAPQGPSLWAQSSQVPGAWQEMALLTLGGGAGWGTTDGVCTGKGGRVFPESGAAPLAHQTADPRGQADRQGGQRTAAAWGTGLRREEGTSFEVVGFCL